MIRKVTIENIPQITEIYNHYIEASIATFEEEKIDTDEMVRRIHKTTENYPWLVFESEEKILGYAYANIWQERTAYRNTVMTTVYLAPHSHGQGIGTKLYEALFEELKKKNYHVFVAGISLPNPASVALHEKFGFEKVAHFKEVGFKFGKWIDVGYWQLNLSND